jgi:hypothetical protein
VSFSLSSAACFFDRSHSPIAFPYMSCPERRAIGVYLHATPAVFLSCLTYLHER